MRVHDSRTEGYHIHSFGVLAAYDPALETGMAGRHMGFFLEHLFVEVHHLEQHRRMRVGRPAGITAVLLHFAAGQFQRRADRVGHFHFGTVHRRTREERNGELAAAHFHPGHIRRSLYQTFHVGAHAEHTVRHRSQCVHDRFLLFFGHYFLRRIDRFEKDFHPLVHRLIFFLYIVRQRLEMFFIGGCLSFGQSEFREGLPRDSIAQRTAVEHRQAQAIFGSGTPQHPVQHFIGVGTAQDDIHPGMPAFQSFYGYFEALHTGRSLFLLVFQGTQSVDTAGATDTQFVFVLRIEVEHDAAFEHFRVHLVGARHTGFFVHCNEHLQGRMGYVGSREYRHRGGYADPVVSSQGRSFGANPVAVHHALDTLLIEIENRIRILLVHHIHMSLKDDDGGLFFALGSRLAEYHVTHFIDGGVYFIFFTELFKECDGFGLFLGAAGHRIEVFKIVPDSLRLEGTNIFAHVFKYFWLLISSLILAKYSGSRAPFKLVWK